MKLAVLAVIYLIITVKSSKAYTELSNNRTSSGVEMTNGIRTPYKDFQLSNSLQSGSSILTTASVTGGKTLLSESKSFVSFDDPTFSNVPLSSMKKLPRHQRAIAAIAEEKGLLHAAIGGERILRRGKRYLQFAKGSRVSWRTNGKNNILNVNTLWGYGYGFRVNFPFPGPDESRRPFFKRDVLHSLEDVLNGHGLDGRACVLKSYCTAILDVDSNISGGMLFKMLKLIFTLHEHDKRHFSYLRLDNCKQILHSHCPLSFDSISPYTDDI
ncbi:unnamed protein product [Ceratitis capitata]|uniref:(Mediterranean fruit fly) hypothetical protein n=2 Tax=Ceratitis capitata TaxID=7213 RepID=A0A811TZH6_CERCA|nr:unnamed protein product [Ceratitis capitata]